MLKYFTTTVSCLGFLFLLQTNAMYAQERHRPAYHFTPPKAWMNDPNGMVYYAGEYHLFYQHYPDATVWGPMHWGHAVSTDLIHWQHLPIALYPDSLGYIFSGSAVVDWHNTSGLGKNNEPPLIAIFTYHDMAAEKRGASNFQSQAIAYSHDKGRTWTKYAGNPVIPNQGIKDFRDPKVSWDTIHNQWVMVLAVQDHVEFWVSSNLLQWQHASSFGKEWGAHGGVWECPDFFILEDPKIHQSKWVLLTSINPGGPNHGSATQYFIGDFDGKTFQLDKKMQESLQQNKAIWLDYGRDNYAGVTWSDLPKEDGRRIFLGWMSNWEYANQVPTDIWRSANTLPRTLALVDTKQGYRLASLPVKEVKHLFLPQKYEARAIHLTPDKPFEPVLAFAPTLSVVTLRFDIPQQPQGELIIELSNTQKEVYTVGYDIAKKQFFSNRINAGKNDFSTDFARQIHVAPRLLDTQTIELQVFFDVASAELFADKGTVNMTELFFPSTPFTKIRLMQTHGTSHVQYFAIQPLKGVF